MYMCISEQRRRLSPHELSSPQQSGLFTNAVLDCLRGGAADGEVKKQQDTEAAPHNNKAQTNTKVATSMRALISTSRPPIGFSSLSAGAEPAEPTPGGDLFFFKNKQSIKARQVALLRTGDDLQALIWRASFPPPASECLPGPSSPFPNLCHSQVTADMWHVSTCCQVDAWM